MLPLMFMVVDAIKVHGVESIIKIVEFRLEGSNSIWWIKTSCEVNFYVFSIYALLFLFMTITFEFTLRVQYGKLPLKICVFFQFLFNAQFNCVRALTYVFHPKFRCIKSKVLYCYLLFGRSCACSNIICVSASTILIKSFVGTNLSWSTTLHEPSLILSVSESTNNYATKLLMFGITYNMVSLTWYYYCNLTRPS